MPETTVCVPDANKYPAHAKLHAVRTASQVIGRFLDWMEHERRPGIGLYIWQNGEYVPACIPIDKLLGEYFGIDTVKLEEEKLAMLDELRAAHEQGVQGSQDVSVPTES